jgi:hypothetical protein
MRMKQPKARAARSVGGYPMRFKRQQALADAALARPAYPRAQREYSPAGRAQLAGPQRRGLKNGPGRREEAALPRWVTAWQQDHRRRLAARAEARADAPLKPGERLLAVARGVGGGLAVATDRALYYQDGRSWARLGWEQVDQVWWDDQRQVLALTGLPPALAAHTLLRLACPWDLPAVAS